jgi:hypothetical protein
MNSVPFFAHLSADLRPQNSLYQIVIYHKREAPRQKPEIASFCCFFLVLSREQYENTTKRRLPLFKTTKNLPYYAIGVFKNKKD